MKKFISLLLPVTGLATVTGCTCSIGGKDPQPLSKDYLEIKDNILYGFKDQYKKHVDFPESSYELIIPKEVTAIADTAFSVIDDEDAGLVLTKVSYEQGCVCTNFGQTSFNGCTNITSVCLPPLFNDLGYNVFDKCKNLTTIDISNVSGNIDFSNWISPYTPEWWSTTGSVVYGDDNQELAQSLAAHINTAVETDGWKAIPKESI